MTGVQTCALPILYRPDVKGIVAQTLRLLSEAAVGALRQRIDDLEAGLELSPTQEETREEGVDVRVGVKDFELALDKLGPSVRTAQRVAQGEIRIVRKYE